MAFKQLTFASLETSNSVTSSEFLTFYENLLEKQVLEARSKPASRTFAPSSFRCSRKSWFRLRGTKPDQLKHIDVTQEFTAQIGTACHRTIQNNLKQALGADWISVADYLTSHPIPYKYTLTPSEDGLETKVAIEDPPIHFACDGIIRWKGKYYLLEIKTSEYNSFTKLTDTKPIHVDQIQCYATLLGIENILVLYQDRQYGGFKCYEMHLSPKAKEDILFEFQHVRFMVESNIAPNRLPNGDSGCNYCEYRQTCKEWG